jgi:aconitate hydratase
MFFGVKAVLAKSFARIHRDNLINYAVLPLAFSDEADYDALDPEDQLEMRDLRQRLEDGATRIPVYNRTKQTTFETTLELTDRERQIVLAGGLLRYVGKESGR